MKHRLLTILATLSLLLLVALLALWIRSRTVIDYLQWTDHRHFPGFVSSDGRIIYSYQFWPNGVGGNEPGLGAGSRPGNTPYWGDGIGEDSRNRFAGFEWSPAATVRPMDSALTKSLRIPKTPTTRLVSAPHWFLCLLASVPVFAWLRSWRRRRRSNVPGLCPSCNYDLRATPDRGPECGTETRPTATTRGRTVRL